MTFRQGFIVHSFGQQKLAYWEVWEGGYSWGRCGFQMGGLDPYPAFSEARVVVVLLSSSGEWPV